MPKLDGLKKYRNWLILGGAAIAGYLVYRRVSSSIAATPLPEPEPMKAQPLAPPTEAAQAAVTPPDLNGPLVKKGVSVSSKSKTCIATKEQGMVYAKVTLTDKVGYQYFKSPRNGRFTRRFLCVKNTKWAEIKPS